MQSRNVNFIEISYVYFFLSSFAIQSFEGDYEGRLNMTPSTLAVIYQTRALHIPKERSLIFM